MFPYKNLIVYTVDVLKKKIVVGESVRKDREEKRERKTGDKKRERRKTLIKDKIERS